MIPTKKLTPLAFGYRVTSLEPPTPELVVILRGKYRLRPGAPLELVRASLDSLADDELEGAGREQLDQAAIAVGQGSLTHDAFAEDDADMVGEVLYPSDFAEFKPAADVMMRGTCYPPLGAAECVAGFGVVGRFHKELDVSGPRVWVDRVAGGKHTDPLGFKRMPLDWAHAYGGPDFPENPVGVGHEGRELPSVERRGARAGAPQPVSFAPLSPSWPARRAKVGKEYGEAYERERAPWYPVDYDWHAQNAAPPDQQVAGFLRGDEALRFVNVHPRSADFTVALPGVRPRAFAMLEQPSGTRVVVEVSLVLDTVFADVDAELAFVTWRGRTKITEDDLADVKFLLFADEPLESAPRPVEHYRRLLEDFAADPYALEENPATELQALEEKLDSGELERELAALPDGADPITSIFGKLLARTPDATATLAGVADLYQRTAAKDPAAKAATNASILVALRAAFDGPSGPRMVIGANGSVEGTGFLRRTMRETAKTEREAGRPPGELTGALRAELEKAEIPGISADDAAVPEALEPPAPEPGADFSGFDLEGRSFAGMDLTGCKFESAMLRGVDFCGATLAGASFRGATLVRVDLSRADCRGADLTQAHLSKCDLSRARLDGANLDQATLSRCELAGASLVEAHAAMLQVMSSKLTDALASRAKLDKCVFSECDARSAVFEHASLPRTLFRETDLTGARFGRSDVSNVGFISCNLRGSSFYAAKGDTVSFQQSVLDEADLRHADLPSAQLSGVPARGADLFAANLPRSRFYKTSLREARLEGANLLQADVRKAVLTDASFREASCFQAAFIEAHGNDADFRGADLVQANFSRSRLVKKS
ncbi:MAG: DUF2169 domain-containing protein [Polyangiaceae bacterium]